MLKKVKKEMKDKGPQMNGFELYAVKAYPIGVF